MECFNCGISDSRVKLFDAISGRGIVKICEKCSSEERLPIVRKPTTFQFEESEKKSSVYERLFLASGIETREENPKKKELEKIEMNLREVADRNYEQKIQTKPRLRPDLVDNFHWIIMRVRRLKKLTQEQLAKEISEPEISIKMAEKGILPEGHGLVNKLENFLEIKLKKIEKEKSVNDNVNEDTLLVEKEPSETSGFDSKDMDNLTIADLKKMKEERESKILGESKILEDENRNS